ncbi:uncharacterized protein DS421_15g491990 [Arachis hypogaea]|nr:uncharacterized protein DS421_15g491990 [Arachis hypogaea]
MFCRLCFALLLRALPPVCGRRWCFALDATTPHTLRPSNLWSQTSTIPTSYPAPQTTSTIVTRASSNSFQSRTTALPPACGRLRRSQNPHPRQPQTPHLRRPPPSSFAGLPLFSSSLCACSATARF